jgi:hypothetical protein
MRGRNKGQAAQQDRAFGEQLLSLVRPCCPTDAATNPSTILSSHECDGGSYTAYVGYSDLSKTYRTISLNVTQADSCSIDSVGTESARD